MGGQCVVLSSMPVSFPMRAYIGEKAFVIGADAGWQNAAALGVNLNLAIGDFDSSYPPQTGVEVVRLLPDKNETDTFYAVKEAITRGFDEVTILGAVGGRFDHTYANLQTLLFLAENNVANLIADEQTEIRCIAPGTVSIAPRPDCYLSVFSVAGSAKGVNLSGVKYPLLNAELSPDFPIGNSNEFLPGVDAKISFEEGYLYIMIVKKEVYIPQLATGYLPY